MKERVARVLVFIRHCGSAGASNNGIRANLGLLSHQSAFNATRRLMKDGEIRGYHYSAGWMFYAR